MNHLQLWKESIKANKISIALSHEFHERELTIVSIESGTMSMQLDVLPTELYVNYSEEEWGEEIDISKVECQIKEKDLFYYYTDEEYNTLTHNEAVEILNYIFMNHSELDYKVVFE